LKGQGIKFEHGQLEDVLTKAKAENKMVFVDVYTTWCGPCKQMVKNIFPLKEVGDFYNNNFINYKLDAEDIKVNGPELSEKYNVGSFPSYLFLDSNGKLAYTTGGSMSAEMFLKAGKKALGEDVNGDYQGIVTKFQNGDHSDEVLYLVMKSCREKAALSDDRDAVNNIMAIYEEAAKIYFKGSPEKFLNQKDFKLLSESYQNQRIFRKHAIIEYIIDNYDEFKSKINEKELGTFLMYVNYSSIQEEALIGNKEGYESYLKDINGCLKAAYAFNDESEIPALEFLTAMGDAEFAIGQKDYDTYLVKYEEYLSYLSDLGAIEYLMPARRIFNYGKGTPTQEQLKKCIPFNQIAYNKYKNAYVCTDFGMLMAKLNEKEKARTYYQEAIEIFETMGDRGTMAIERLTKEMNELGL